ncbi:hypothetical protein CC80DRAFT_191390 [Byssothecium circinans]|uniref:Uncharacterized protein n=1 Tax=Byssothecium circinans TaxID=147558 RepID=A0A6A5TRV8_9PLEO|nr:hypothetical protein CC80DRAFT_191390 [Byssothecium circinans]
MPLQLPLCVKPHRTVIAVELPGRRHNYLVSFITIFTTFPTSTTSSRLSPCLSITLQQILQPPAFFFQNATPFLVCPVAKACRSRPLLFLNVLKQRPHSYTTGGPCCVLPRCRKTAKAASKVGAFDRVFSLLLCCCCGICIRIRICIRHHSVHTTIITNMPFSFTMHSPHLPTQKHHPTPRALNPPLPHHRPRRPYRPTPAP